MSDFLQGSQVTLLANFLDSQSQPITAGVSGVTVDVYYYLGTGTQYFDVTAAPMTQDISNLNRFYYLYDIPQFAPLTNRIINYSAMFSGLSIQYTETASVITPLSGSVISPGSVIVSGNVVDISGTGINNAGVIISLYGGSNSFITSTVTISGLYTVYLDPGDYYGTFSAAGYQTNIVVKTVPTGMPFFNFGNTTLSQNAGGSLVISDTYVIIADENGAEIPLSGLRVSLFDKSLVESKPISIAYTDANGTFTMSANPGMYALLVVGTQPNNTVFKTAYDIEVDAMFANASSTNFRYLGTSQYNFLI